jgi:L-iditol 2-dehydrogenase/L-gulonate 5-dehydrogenase
MLAMMLDRPEEYRVVDVAMPEPGEGQALIKVARAGICASDLATIHGVSPIATYPLIPGHECAGEIVSAPEDSGYGPGDRVTIFPSVGCGECPACREDRTNHCPTFKVQGISLPGGCFAEYLATNVEQLVRLPDHVYERFGPLVEPLAVGTHVNRRGGTSKGETVLVIGTGAIGLASALVARAKGAAKVLLVDRFESRRQVAAGFGFADFSTDSGEALAAWVESRVGSVDLVLDNVTNDQTVAVAARVLRPGGRCVLIGMPHGDRSLTLPHPQSYRKELSFVVSRNYVKDDFVETVALLDAEAFDPTPMITATYPLASMAEALKALYDNPEKHIKVLVEP